MHGRKSNKRFSLCRRFSRFNRENITNNKKIKYRILNVGGGSPIAVKKVIEKINKIIKKGKPQFGKIQMRKDESLELYPSIKKLKIIYKWKPKFSLIKGLKKTILFYKKNKNFLY